MVLNAETITIQGVTNFHRKPFDEGTLLKLELFEKYAKDWLPVFLAPTSYSETITIADFFAGPGVDSQGVRGSPLILVEQIRSYATSITGAPARIRLEFNEASRSKADALEASLRAAEIPTSLCAWKVRSLSFADAFESVYPLLRKGPNLLLLDQQGVKFISDDIFLRMTQLPKTDFIFFIASSFIRRFADHPHFRKHLAIPKGKISASTFSDTHRVVTDHYRKLLPANSDYFVGRFSIKKGSNLYGLIFGSAHPRGIEKFLRVCWKIDPERGEANFDIDHDDLDPRRPHLFPDMDVARKTTIFQAQLRELVLGREIRSDGQVYLHCLREGMLPKHGREVISRLKREGRMLVEQRLQARVSFDGYKQPRRLEVANNGEI